VRSSVETRSGLCTLPLHPALIVPAPETLDASHVAGPMIGESTRALGPQLDYRRKHESPAWRVRSRRARFARAAPGSAIARIARSDLWG